MNPEGGKSPLSTFFDEKLCVDAETAREHAEHAKAVYQPVRQQFRNKLKLAVVGGGPSVEDHLFTLRFWPGVIWGVKGAVKWLAQHKIKSTLVSAHPIYNGEDYPHYADKALLSEYCPPSLFKACRNPLYFHAEGERNFISGGCTTLARTPHLAAFMGFTEVHYFGADSSMADVSHTYEHKENRHRLEVECGGKIFKTQPDWVWQAEYMQKVFAVAPKVFKNHSGGLMQAMIENEGQYTIIGLETAKSEMPPIPRKRGRPRKVA